jgi:hypothetical protein
MDSNIRMQLHPSPPPTCAAPADSPFHPDNQPGYRRWREAKLAAAPRRVEELVVSIKDALGLSAWELERLRACCHRANMAIFETREPSADTARLAALGAQLGLHRLDANLCADEDGISALSCRAQGRQAEYIPYTNRPLSWHTDGYYNAPEQQVRAWILYCVEPAAQGGANALLDHELAYLLMRDADPEMVRALMAADAMSVPPNIEEGREIRPTSTGPVFSVDATGALHMRYSARQRNILWKADQATEQARAWLERLLSDPAAPIFEYRLGAGQGLVSNNVLHRREGFRDNPQAGRARLLLRARYYDRIAGT